jgi:8-oxo-dGTP pyrophosphatase MutT (NUDIX family)
LSQSDYEKYERPEVVVACVIENKANKVLMLEQKKWGFKSPSWKRWVIPGGHLHGEPVQVLNDKNRDETLLDAMIREIREETSIIVLDADRSQVHFVGVFTVKYPDEYYRRAYFIVFLFYYKVPENVTRFRNNSESSAWDWIDVDNASQKPVCKNSNGDEINVTSWTVSALRIVQHWKETQELTLEAI